MDCVFKTLSYLTSMKKHLAKIFKGETPRCKQFLQKAPSYMFGNVLTTPLKAIPAKNIPQVEDSQK